MAGVLDLSFLHDIVEFALALDSLNADISECECNKYCFQEIGGLMKISLSGMTLTSHEI